MLLCGQALRFSASELSELHKLTGPCYFEPRTVTELNELSQKASDFWLSLGEVKFAEAVGQIQIH